MENFMRISRIEINNFRTKKGRNLDLVTSPKLATKNKYKIAIKVVDIF